MIIVIFRICMSEFLRYEVLSPQRRIFILCICAELYAYFKFTVRAGLRSVGPVLACGRIELPWTVRPGDRWASLGRVGWILQCMLSCAWAEKLSIFEFWCHLLFYDCVIVESVLKSGPVRSFDLASIYLTDYFSRTCARMRVWSFFSVACICARLLIVV